VRTRNAKILYFRTLVFVIKQTTL